MDLLNVDFAPGHVAFIYQESLLMELQKSGKAGYLVDVPELKEARPFLLLESDRNESTWVALTTKPGKGYRYKINRTQKKGSDKRFNNRDSYVFHDKLLRGPLCAFTSCVTRHDYHIRRITECELNKVRQAVLNYPHSVPEKQTRGNQYFLVEQTVEPLLSLAVLAQLQSLLAS